MKKQLVLRKETLRNLASRQLSGVRGGGTNTETVTDSWWITDCSCETIPPWTWVDDTFTIRFGSNDMCIVWGDFYIRAGCSLAQRFNSRTSLCASKVIAAGASAAY